MNLIDHIFGSTESTVAFFVFLQAVAEFLKWVLNGPKRKADAVSVLTTQLVRLTEILDKKDERADRIDNELRTIRNERDGLSRTIEQLQADNRKKDQEISTLANRIRFLETEDKASKKRIGELEENSRQKDQQIEQMRSQIGELEKQRDNNLATITNLEGIKAELENRIGALESKPAPVEEAKAESTPA